MGIYQMIYDIIHTYIYGSATMTSSMELVATEVSTLLSLVLFALPVILLFKFIRWCF